MGIKNVALTIGLIIATSSVVGAQVVCVKNSPHGGPLRVRAACKTTEVQLGSLQAVQLLLGAISSQDAGATLRLSGVNLQIVSGSGSTDGPVNGKGNLIIGYNTDNGGDGVDSRTGSHNLVIGDDHTYTSSGGFVGGLDNTIAAEGATVLTGNQNLASASYSCVVNGGENDATNTYGTVGGGFQNTASGPFSSVSGGSANTASGTDSSVSGGGGRTAPDFQDWAAGSLFEDD